MCLLLWGVQLSDLTPGLSRMRARRLAPQLMSFRLKPQPKTPPPPTYRVPVTTSQPCASWTLRVTGGVERTLTGSGAMYVTAVSREPDLIISGMYLGCRHVAGAVSAAARLLPPWPVVTASSMHHSRDGTGLRP